MSDAIPHSTLAGLVAQPIFELAIAQIQAADLREDIESRIAGLRRVNTAPALFLANFVEKMVQDAMNEHVRTFRDNNLKRAALLLSCVAIGDL